MTSLLPLRDLRQLKRTKHRDGTITVPVPGPIFAKLVESLEVLNSLYVEEINGRLCRLPDDTISDSTRREEGTCDTCSRKWDRVVRVLGYFDWSGERHF